MIIQQVLEIIAKFTGEVAQCFHNGLEVLPKVRGFPRIRILQAAAGNELLKRAAEEICKSGLPGLPTWNVSLLWVTQVNVVILTISSCLTKPVRSYSAS